jgi:hypothetical protein
MQGGLGHQVLAQLMIAGSGRLAVAGAAMVLAGAAGRGGTAAQVVIRTAIPALALQVLFEQREQLLRRRERDLLPHAKAIAARDFDLELRNGVLERQNASLQSRNDSMRKVLGAVTARLRVLEKRQRHMRAKRRKKR